MKKIISAILFTMSVSFMISCGGGDKKLDDKEQKAVETQVQNDQAAMDSLEKAIQSQIDAMPDDSLMKGEH